MAVPVASFQGGLLISQGDARREHWAHFAQRLELCQALGIETLVIAGDVVGPIGASKISSGCEFRWCEAASEGGRAGVRLALEFQAKATLSE